MPCDHRPSFGDGGSANGRDANGKEINAALVFNGVVDYNVLALAMRRSSRAPNATEPAFFIWLIGAGRFCLAVRPGRHVLLRDSWHLDNGAGLQRISSPLARAWDEALLVSREVHRVLKRRASFMPAVYFPDTEPNAHIREVAERSHVAAIWKPDRVARRLSDIMAADPQHNPPSRSQALEELTSLINPNARPTGPP
ncbi:MAG: hypothetical protein OXE87_08055 [Chloroflexi bacterium]|nr:hypothetical protein [Chloroflexota bacterium]